MFQIIYEKRWQLLLLCIIIRIIQKILNKKDQELLTSKHQIVYYSKVLYIRGLRKSLTIMYMYLTIRMISMIFIKNTYINIIEYFIITSILMIYIKNLKRKYIISVNNKQIDKNIPIIINKIIVLILSIGFIYYTSSYFSNIFDNNSDISMKVSDYHYNIAKDENGLKVIEVSFGNDNYMMSQINERNYKYIDEFLSLTKSIINYKIIKVYFVSFFIFLALLLISQTTLKNFKFQLNSYISDFIILLMLLSLVVICDTSIDDKRENLNIYFHKYMAKNDMFY